MHGDIVAEAESKAVNDRPIFTIYIVSNSYAFEVPFFEQFDP